MIILLTNQYSPVKNLEPIVHHYSPYFKLVTTSIKHPLNETMINRREFPHSVMGLTVVKASECRIHGADRWAKTAPSTSCCWRRWSGCITRCSTLRRSDVKNSIGKSMEIVAQNGMIGRQNGRQIM